MIDDLLNHPHVVAWREKHPQQWWAFEHLSERSKVREGVLAAILAGRLDDEYIDQLTRFGEALRDRKRATQDGTVLPPPQHGERRPFQLYIKRMKKMEKEEQMFFRVDFYTDYGWSGYFDTNAPAVVERIHKHRNKSKPLTVVAEVERRPHDFLVVLGGRIQIV